MNYELFFDSDRFHDHFCPFRRFLRRVPEEHLHDLCPVLENISDAWRPVRFVCHAVNKHLNTVDSEKAYIAGVDALFADNDKIICEDGEHGEKTLSYTIAVTNGQNLNVTLKVHYPEGDDDSLFKVEKWTTNVNREWLETVKDGASGESGAKLLFQ